jgi:hypothetical protein
MLRKTILYFLPIIFLTVTYPTNKGKKIMPVNTIELEHAIIKHVLVNVIPTLDKGTMFGSEQNEFFEACNTIFLN